MSVMKWYNIMLALKKKDKEKDKGHVDVVDGKCIAFVT